MSVSPTTEQPKDADARTGGTQGWQWWPLVAVCLIELMVLGDVGLVNVAALPYIQEDLHAANTDLPWITGMYTLGLASLLLAAGTLADRVGRKGLMVGGLVLLLAAQIGNAAASSVSVLIAFRLVQGIAAAGIFAVSLAVLSDRYHGKSRGVAFGVWGAMAAASIALGSMFGNILAKYVGWQAVFLVVQIPLCLAAIAITVFRVPLPTAERRPVDWPGTVLGTLGVGSLVFLLIRGGEVGWGNTIVWACGAAAAVLLVAYLVVELRVSAPGLPLSHFRSRAFAAAQLAAFALAATHVALMFLLTLYLRRVHGFDAGEAGRCLLVLTGPAVLAALATGRLAGRVSPRWALSLGLLLNGVGVLLLRAIEPGSAWTVMIPGLVLMGLGSGVFTPVLGLVAMGTASREHSGMASGAVYTFRQLGLVTGTAVYGVVFKEEIVAKLGDALPRLPAPAVEGLSKPVSVGQFDALRGVAPRPQQQTFVDAGIGAFIGGLDTVFLVAGIAGIVLAALVPVLAWGFAAGQEPASEPSAPVANLSGGLDVGLPQT